MLSVFIGILTVVIVIVSVLLILIVLMQRPKQEGLGAAFGGGMMDSVAGAHTTDVLQKGTVWLASIFLGGAILLAVLKARELKAVDPGEVLPDPAAEIAEPGPPPSIGDMPTSVIPEMPKSDATPPAAPAKGEKGEEKADTPPAPKEQEKGDAEKPASAPASGGEKAAPEKAKTDAKGEKAPTPASKTKEKSKDSSAKETAKEATKE